MRQNATTMKGTATDKVLAVGLGDGVLVLVWLVLVVGDDDVRGEVLEEELTERAGEMLVCNVDVVGVVRCAVDVVGTVEGPADGEGDVRVEGGLSDEGVAGIMLCTPYEVDELPEFLLVAGDCSVFVGSTVVAALDVGGKNGCGLKIVKVRVMFDGGLR